MQLSCSLLVIIIWSVFKKNEGVRARTALETVIERRLNYSQVVLHVRVGVCARTRAFTVCATETGPDMESHHTERDNQIMIKTKQMVT